MNSFINTIHESQRTTFLTVITPGAKSTLLINEILTKIEEDKEESTYSQYASTLISMAANFSEQQLIRAVNLKAIKDYCYSPNHAEQALFGIMKEISYLPLSLKTLFIKILEEVNFVGFQNKSFKDHCAFQVLLQFANTNNPEILTSLSEIIISRINHNDQQVQISASYWLELLAPRLTQLPDQLISAAILALDNERDQYALKALKAVACQLSASQLTKYIYQNLSLLNQDKNEDKIRGCRIIGALTSNLSPCPEDIILKLISLEKSDDRAISHTAFEALTNLTPNLLNIKSGIINKVLINEYNGCGIAYNSIIKLATSISTKDITDNLIYNLIDSKPKDYNEYQLKDKAINSLSKRFSDSQLNSFINYCLQRTKWEIFPKGSALTAIPTYLLNGRLEELFKKYSSLLNDENWNIRSRACDSIRAFKTLLPMSPEGFILDFVTLLNDDDYRVSDSACNAMPEILYSVHAQDLSKVYEILISEVLRNEKDFGSYKIRKTACECLGLLAPKLSQEQVNTMKDQLILSLNDEDWDTRLNAFKSLTLIAHRFSDDELTSLIITLARKSEQHTFEYIRQIPHLITNTRYCFKISLRFS
ncbi:MAG: hypothetical protein H0T84_10080 [Tatlockia sp.]|nr:hypothetical protein [Tatlockia sp.]